MTDAAAYRNPQEPCFDIAHLAHVEVLTDRPVMMVRSVVSLTRAKTEFVQGQKKMLTAMAFAIHWINVWATMGQAIQTRMGNATT